MDFNLDAALNQTDNRVIQTRTGSNVGHSRQCQRHFGATRRGYDDAKGDSRDRKKSPSHSAALSGAGCCLVHHAVRHGLLLQENLWPAN
jgi:hypothetical protein